MACRALIVAQLVGVALAALSSAACAQEARLHAPSQAPAVASVDAAAGQQPEADALGQRKSRQPSRLLSRVAVSLARPFETSGL